MERNRIRGSRASRRRPGGVGEFHQNGSGGQRLPWPAASYCPRVPPRLGAPQLQAREGLDAALGESACPDSGLGGTFVVEVVNCFLFYKHSGFGH